MTACVDVSGPPAGEDRRGRGRGVEAASSGHLQQRCCPSVRGSKCGMGCQGNGHGTPVFWHLEQARPAQAPIPCRIPCRASHTVQTHRRATARAPPLPKCRIRWHCMPPRWPAGRPCLCRSPAGRAPPRRRAQPPGRKSGWLTSAGAGPERALALRERCMDGCKDGAHRRGLRMLLGCTSWHPTTCAPASPPSQYQRDGLYGCSSQRQTVA